MLAGEQENPCAGCTMCCKLLGIGDEFRGEKFRKPTGKWCPHCAIGKGCTVYEERPSTCVDFQCAYLVAVLQGEAIDPQLRPDRCGVVIAPTTDEEVLAVHVDKNKADAWRRGAVYARMLDAARSGYRLTISIDSSTRKLVMSLRGSRIIIEEHEFTESDENGMQWTIPGKEKFVEEIGR